MMDELLELIDDAIEKAQWAHEPRDHASRCSCGVVNNMDGDVLPSHLHFVVSEAVREVLERNLREEQRTLADGMGGMSIDSKTGKTTAHLRPCTQQSRWVTPWLTTNAEAIAAARKAEQ
jgi:hypothetical protein